MPIKIVPIKNPTEDIIYLFRGMFPKELSKPFVSTQSQPKNKTRAIPTKNSTIIKIILTDLFIINKLLLS